MKYVLIAMVSLLALAGCATTATTHRTANEQTQDCYRQAQYSDQYAPAPLTECVASRR